MENLTLEQKKSKIREAIYNRAYELTCVAEELRGILFPKNASSKEINDAALKKAVQEFKENKALFSL